jgi:hypothetical protein
LGRPLAGGFVEFFLFLFRIVDLFGREEQSAIVFQPERFDGFGVARIAAESEPPVELLLFGKVLFATPAGEIAMCVGGVGGGLPQLSIFFLLGVGERLGDCFDKRERFAVDFDLQLFGEFGKRGRLCLWLIGIRARARSDCEGEKE